MIFVEALITTRWLFSSYQHRYSMDGVEESARVAGFKQFQVAWRITFPIVFVYWLRRCSTLCVHRFETPAIIARRGIYH
jgi:ABC-type sulfate transport system permease component